MEQITSIVEQITHWGLTGIWKILFAIIIWFVGKKVIALCMKFLKKVFDKDFEKIKNELAYERLQREIEYSHSM